MGLKGFERRLERLVEGVFARAFKSGLSPVELGRRLVREMDDQRTVNVKGATAVPNVFSIALAPEDHEQFGEIEESLVRELEEAARTHARDEGYVFMGPVEVTMSVDGRLRVGAFEVEARFKEGEAGAGAGSVILPSGDRLPLGRNVITIGRSTSSDVVLDDANVSRAHAEIRPEGDGWLVVDLDSTNGTRVNGSPIRQRRLSDGDQIAVGSSTLRFEAS
jgi:hypothetical protein